MKKLITSILIAICAVGVSLSANAQSTAVLTAVCTEDAVSGSEFTVDFVLSENSVRQAVGLISYTMPKALNL